MFYFEFWCFFFHSVGFFWGGGGGRLLPFFFLLVCIYLGANAPHKKVNSGTKKNEWSTWNSVARFLCLSSLQKRTKAFVRLRPWMLTHKYVCLPLSPPPRKHCRWAGLFPRSWHATVPCSAKTKRVRSALLFGCNRRNKCPGARSHFTPSVKRTRIFELRVLTE